MTTEIRVQTASSAKSTGNRYVTSDGIAVVSVACERLDANLLLREAFQQCVARFESSLHAWLRYLSQDRVLLFAATGPSHQHNVLSRRRGIWGTDDLRWLPAHVLRSPNVEVVGKGGLRFAGVAEVDEASFFEAADFARTHRDSFLLVSPHASVTEERVRALVAKVLPNEQRDLDWKGAIALVEESEDICIRAFGDFDDREVSIDAFLSNDLLQKMAAS